MLERLATTNVPVLLNDTATNELQVAN